MNEYRILAKVKLNFSDVDAQIATMQKKIKPISLPINEKSSNKLNATYEKLQNRLEGLKISNRDAFKTQPVIEQSGKVSALFELYRRGKVNLDDVQIAFGKLTNEVKRANQEIRTTSSNTDNFSTAIGKAVGKIALWGMATSILYGSLRKIQEGIQYVKDLNKEITNIGLVTGQTVEQLSGTTEKLNDIAKQLGVSTLDAAKGYIEWARQGRSAEESMILLANSTKLAQLGSLEASDATTKLTAAMNAFGISAEDSIKIVDVIVALDQKFATSTAEITEAMEESSSMARQAGIEYQNLASYITVISSITRQSGDTIGNALKSIVARMMSVKAGADFDEMGESINNVEKVLKRYDIELRDSTLAFRDLDDVLADAAKKYNELGEAGATAAQGQITSALAGLRQANYLAALFQNWDQVTKAQEVASNSMGTTSEKYEIYLKSIEASANRSKATWEKVWQITINSKVIKFFYDLSSGIGNVVGEMGGLIPIVLKLAGAFIAINFKKITEGISSATISLKMFFQALKVGAVQSAAQFAVATAGISLIIGGLIWSIGTLSGAFETLEDKAAKTADEISQISARMTELHDTKDDVSKLWKELETLKEKSSLTAEEQERMIEIQNRIKRILPEVNGEYDNQGNYIVNLNVPLAEYVSLLNQQYEAESRLLSLKSQKLLKEDIKIYKKDIDKLKGLQSMREAVASYRSGEYTPASIEEAMTLSQVDLEKLDENIAEIQVRIQTRLSQMRVNYLNLNKEMQDEILKSPEIIGEGFDEILSVWSKNITDISETTKEKVEEISLSFGELKNVTDAINAVTSAAAEQSKEGQISYATALDLISANSDLAMYLIKTADGYIFDAEAARLATQAEMINQFTKYGLRDAAIAAANGNYVFAQSAIAASKATEEQKKAMLDLLKAFAAMSVKISVGGGTSGINAQTDAVKKLHDAQKQAYQDEIKSINKRRKALEAQKKALEDQKKAYKELIDAKKESLRLAKEESDYNKDLEEKNKELADIENELFSIQFDNSQEAAALRLQLEEEKAKKIEEISQFQADRTYDIQIQALDKEYDAFAAMIDKQIAGIDRMISKFNTMIDKINEAIDALNRLGNSGTSTSSLSGTGDKVPSSNTSGVLEELLYGVTPKSKLNEYSSGGAGKVPYGYPNDGAMIRVESDEAFAVLNRQQQQQFSSNPIASLFGMVSNQASIPLKTISNNNERNTGDVNVIFNVNGNLDKMAAKSIEETIFSSLNNIMKLRGKKTNVFVKSL